MYISKLPHRLRDKNTGTTRLADPNEMNTDGTESEQYTFWGTSAADFDEFGIGIGLYFRQLLFFAGLLFVCSGLSFISIVHNGSVCDQDDISQVSHWSHHTKAASSLLTW